MKKVLACSVTFLALSLFSCGDTGVNVGGGGDDGGGGGGGGGGGKKASNAVVITLTGWETKETDLLGDTKLDPKISFTVTAIQGGRVVSNNSTGALLDQDNVGQSWSGNARSSPVPFISSADELRIYATVIEKDPLASDDISPNYYASWMDIPSAGYSGSTSIGQSAKGTSKVTFSYQFISQ